MSISRFLLGTATLAVVGAAGYAAGTNGVGQGHVAAFLEGVAVAAPSESAGSGRIIYYRHPDGMPEYSSGPRNTDDGRPFKAVLESEDISFDRADVPPQVNKAERRVLYYRNPMGLPDTSPVPKKDSMGMDYLPVYEGEEADAGSIRLSLGKLQRTGVKTAIAERQIIQRKIRVPGTVQFDERRIQVVAMRTDAFIDDVANVTTGDQVSRGDRLFSFYSGDIARAAAEFAAQIRGGAEADLNAGGGLQLRNLGVPEDTIRGIAKDRAVPRSLQYYAPSNGVVLERPATTGMMAEAGDVLFRIADSSTVWVIADVPEYDLASVKAGQPVTVKLANLPGEEFHSTIGLIYPDVQAQTRTAKVRIELPNPDGRLLANMFAEVEIATGNDQPVIALPSSAIVETGSRQVVFVDKGEGRFEPRNVKPGIRGNDLSEVKEGIEEGEKVVISANFLLDAESNLTSALNAMTPQEVEP
ncbi:efflux RND transporter periplasmic adaptor subunit [Rhizobium sp. LC145]|uniref:efflux RND transporter periplasmic adaptor subunit n=1 Tax=Rhizobium sp. LC145 TaxID=1120688 RepID=UPI00062A023C|nr:efflux RND transporter periplasmic adaptor subunit [Rhizobium sp. LC145]KKX29426.1 cation transporter [Rhizobium sp. LC145]MDX3927965.1 efflux RND transporter periplasmic adaptor subunit [Shinella sp.]TKT66197.1 efflux RND transporter periplasmic adaptor subunit [Rhizobiaceae bacterium LC148]